MKKRPIKTKGKPVSNLLSWIASALLLIMALGWSAEPASRLVRVYLNGDETEKLKCDFSVDGVKAKWGYACFVGSYQKNVQKFGVSYLEPVNELVRLPSLNRAISGDKLNINGQIFSNGIGSHAPSKLAFDLQGKYSRFSCEVGFDKTSSYNHGVIFSLIGDGKEIYKSPKLSSSADPFPIDCSVTGIKELVLFADNIRFDDVFSNVDWVDLKFEPKPENN